MSIPVWLLKATEDELVKIVLREFKALERGYAFSYAEISEAVIGPAGREPLVCEAQEPSPIRVAIDRLVTEGKLLVGYHPDTNVQHWYLAPRKRTAR